MPEDPLFVRVRKAWETIQRGRVVRLELPNVTYEVSLADSTITQVTGRLGGSNRGSRDEEIWDPAVADLVRIHPTRGVRLGGQDPEAAAASVEEFLKRLGI